ncbi:MAG: histidinol dehydrogenase [Candidatus Eremiobacteraeota bacterium]|nr:histidinol dehydrogenase [Candidatus Eremiobacteraeota bacterium]
MIPVLRGQDCWKWLDAHGPLQDDSIAETVGTVIDEVRSEGDQALLRLARRFGDPEQIELSSSEVEKICAQLDPGTKALLDRAAARIKRFAEAVMAGLKPVTVEGEGYRVGQRFQPVKRVGCYAPGGRYPLPSTALMTTIPARVAGVETVSLTCPAPHPAVLYAGTLAQVDHFYCVGGAQAVAALAFGTDTIKPVDMVVGPGNAFVTEAKRRLQGVIGIDMLAGPSEVALIADETADPKWIALDLLAQAEHDPMAKVCLMTSSENLARDVLREIGQNQDLKPDFIEESLNRGALLVLTDLKECIRASERFAAEHLQVYSEDPSLREALKDYGALFLGPYSAVALGDYGSGPNHTLPTGRAARFSSGLSPLTYLRTQSWLQATEDAQDLFRDTVEFAELEGLRLHAASARARVRSRR